MIPETEGKNEFVALKVMGQGIFLQSIVFDGFIFRDHEGFL